MRPGLLIVLVLSLSACASAVSSGYGQGGRDSNGRSYEETRADNLIRAAVISALVRDRAVPAMEIDVRSEDGVVTLSGTVPSRAIASRAESIAAAQADVKRVVNRLRVQR